MSHRHWLRRVLPLRQRRPQHCLQRHQTLRRRQCLLQRRQSLQRWQGVPCGAGWASRSYQTPDGVLAAAQIPPRLPLATVTTMRGQTSITRARRAT